VGGGFAVWTNVATNGTASFSGSSTTKGTDCYADEHRHSFL
jgi:hypothetical protein